MKMSGTPITPTRFIQINEEAAWVLLPREHTQAIMAVESGAKLFPHREAIKAVVCSSEFGSRLMSCAVKGIVAEELQMAVKVEATEMMKQAEIDDLKMRTHINNAMGRIERISCIKMLPQRRITSIIYGELVLEMPVKSAGQEAELALHASMRSEATKRGCLMPLPAELEVLTSPAAGTGKIGDGVLRHARAARSYLSALLKEEKEEELSGDTVMVPLRSGHLPMTL